MIIGGARSLLTPAEASALRPSLRSVGGLVNARHVPLGFAARARSADSIVTTEVWTKSTVTQEDGRFAQFARDHEHILDSIREQFRTRLHRAIEHQTFPIDRRQVDQRIDAVTLGFKHPGCRVTARGVYMPRFGLAVVNPGRLVQVHADVYHEMLHAVSSHRFVKEAPDELVPAGVGLTDFADYRGRWMNEALTELLACILLDQRGQAFDLSDPDRAFTDVDRELVYRLIGGRRLPAPPSWRSYEVHIRAFLEVMSRIPIGVLTKPYFLQDLDTPEDLLAGTRAVVGLEAALESVGGPERIGRLAAIDAPLADGSYALAQRLAAVIYRQDNPTRSLYL